MLDDVFTYHLGADHYLTVTNAANHEERDFAWFTDHARRARRRGDRSRRATTRCARTRCEGRSLREIVQADANAPLPERMTVGERVIGGAEALVAGTGYTGEDGVELLLAPAAAPAVWDGLIRRGAKPVGLAARDTLRTEVCYHLYGNDLSLERGPIEAGLGWCCKEETGFIGSEAVRAARENPPPERLVPFVLTGGGVARAGDAVIGGGVVTSGTFSPSLEIGIGLAYLARERASEGTDFEIDVRGRTRPARVAKRPLYTRP